jgi:hypothetical protein
MRSLPVLVVSIVASLAAASLAQVIYEPPAVQYSDGQRSFYYGGTDPVTIHRGFYYGFGKNAPLEEEPLRVYTDRLPDQNAAIYGFTIDDARNEAAANTPTYFRKADAVRGTRYENGAIVIPQRPVVEAPRGSIMVRPYIAPQRRAYQPVIVIPKRLLDRPIRVPSA